MISKAIARLISNIEAASCMTRIIILNGEVKGNSAKYFDIVAVGFPITKRIPENALAIKRMVRGIVDPFNSSGRLTIDPNTAYSEAYKK